MHLVKKYTGTAMDRLLLDLMVQGVFEGANTPDFRDAVVLHRITKVPLPDSNWVRVNCPSEFRYLRYRGPKGSNSCIAEAMFFDADGKLIRGACIGTPSAENGKTWDCTKVYDGSKHTYFAAQDADTSWAGLQLAIPVRVSRICYIPRNDDNFVKPGDLYELLVWDRGQWYTMGRQVPDTYGLDYEGVPAGHLYWLRVKKIVGTGVLLVLALALQAGVKMYTLKSPDGKVKLEVTAGQGIAYSLFYDGRLLLKPSRIALHTDLPEADHWENIRITGTKQRHVSETVQAPFYRVKEFGIDCNELELRLNNGFLLLMRAYNDGMAYRFVAGRKGEMTVVEERAEFNFADDFEAYIPYSTNPKDPWNMAFQNFYTKAPLTQYNTELPAFLPLTVDAGAVKLTLLESDLEAYPGMFVCGDGKTPALKGVFAAYPQETFKNKWRCQETVKTRRPYIARVAGKRTFPWRIMAVTAEDTQMPVNHLVYALAAPNRIGDYNWIKPGKVAWEWWNDWGISGVDFKVGINTPTYKHYIDFAAEQGIEYVVLDEGWSDPKQGDIMATVPEIDLPELAEYARNKGVGLILWAVMNVLDEQLEKACRYYAGMGIKGFKVDFLDRDDQKAVEMVYRIAETTAKYKLFVDFHGMYKPTGINRTFPNAINFEGVFGMEELKWSNPDMPLYDVTMPFIRMMAGNVDYTQGAMRNAVKKDFRDIYSSPMSQGTRCHQLATYIVFDSPLVMLCDAPTAYRKEPECTRFIAGLPVVADETRILQGKMGEYIVTARRVGEDWIVGGLTDWEARTVDLDLSFLPEGMFRAEIFCDGINADKKGEDYRHEYRDVKREDRLKMQLAPGGGFAIRLKKNHN